jgi:hypothetical protein
VCDSNWIHYTGLDEGGIKDGIASIGYFASGQYGTGTRTTKARSSHGSWLSNRPKQQHDTNILLLLLPTTTKSQQQQSVLSSQQQTTKSITASHWEQETIHVTHIFVDTTATATTSATIWISYTRQGSSQIGSHTKGKSGGCG